MLLFPITLVCEKNNVLYKWGKEERAGSVHWLRRSTWFHTITGHREPGGGGTPIHYPLIRVCAAQRGRDFKAPDLERGIHFRGVL